MAADGSLPPYTLIIHYNQTIVMSLDDICH